MININSNIIMFINGNSLNKLDGPAEIDLYNSSDVAYKFGVINGIYQYIFEDDTSRTWLYGKGKEDGWYKVCQSIFYNYGNVLNSTRQNFDALGAGAYGEIIRSAEKQGKKLLVVN